LAVGPADQPESGVPHRHRFAQVELNVREHARCLGGREGVARVAQRARDGLLSSTLATRLSEARSSKLIDCAKTSAMLATRPKATQSTMINTEPPCRRPKSETETLNKPEARSPNAGVPRAALRHSGLGFRLPRISDFGLRFQPASSQQPLGFKSNS
jgi:hypothetical protein